MRKDTPETCSGRYTASSSAIAAPSECPTSVTFFAPYFETPVFTAARTLAAVLEELREYMLRV